MAFGSFWGAWGASLPAIREQAGLSHGQLGTALLFVGAGALPAMLLTGGAVDRWGQRVTAPLLLALGVTGVTVLLTGHGLIMLCIGLAVLGTTSGAVDVAINAAAGSAEHAAGRPIITRAHGVFSASVVVASLGTGLLRSIGCPVAVPFLLVAIAAGAAAIAVVSDTPRPPSSGAINRTRRPESRSREHIERMPILPLLTIGGLGALAFAVENAHQSWSAVYLGDQLFASPVIAAAGPALFAAVVAVTRFAISAVDTRHATAILVTGGASAAAGTTVVAMAETVAVALSGLGLAAAGTAVLYPTLLSLVTAHVDGPARGRATSLVATTGYLGFLAGPIYVGRWSAAVGLSGAMLAVAALAALLALITWPALRTHQLTRTHSDSGNHRRPTSPASPPSVIAPCAQGGGPPS